jgi:hypothetical protein
MIFYSWTALKKNDLCLLGDGGREKASGSGSGDAGPPVAMGITDDRGRAMQAGEETLGSGLAAVVIIEAVRPAMGARTLAPCYARTGVAWLGRRTQDGGVAWNRFFLPADPDEQPGLAGLNHETPDLH